MVMAGLFGANSSRAGSPLADDAEYRRALSFNDQGRGQEALLLLAELLEQHPNVLRYRFDYAAVASASGEHAQALAAIAQALEGQAPRYVLEALFHSALTLPDEARAERLDALLADRYGAEPGNEIRLCHLELQLGQYEKALTRSAQLIMDFPQRQDALDLRAYALRQSGRPGEALLVYQEIQRLYPEDGNSKKAIGMLLTDLGSPRLSTRTLESQNVRLDLNESLRLVKDQGAQHIRWADGDQDAPGLRFHNIDLAIATLSAARADALAGNADPDLLASIRGNLVIAYHARNRWPEAIAEYELLRAASPAISEDVRRVAASSYASLGRFSEAEAILRQLVEETPDSYEPTLARINVLADLERFDEAELASADLLARIARTQPNNRPRAYTSVRLTQAMLPAYRNRYADSKLSLDKLQIDAPGSQDVTEAAGTLAAWREQPRKAEEQFRIVLGEQPERMESRLGLANARMDRGDTTLLRQTVDELGPDYAAQASVRDARRRLELHDDYYIVADTTFGGDQYAVAGNRTQEFDIKAYSRPLGDGSWRAFGRERYQSSGPAVDTSLNNVSTGLQHQVTDWTTEIEAGAGGYGRLQTNHALSDQWSANLAIERNLFFRPSQAVAAGVTANRASLGLNWRQDEDFDIGSGYILTDFSDNQRSEAFLVASKNLYRDYDRRLTAAARIAGQHNSDPDVSYFSPSQQLEVSGTLTFEIRQWQDVTTKKSSLWHRFWVTAGEVSQQGFATKAMSNIGYGQEIALSDRFRIRWSIASTHYPYDGVKSSYYTGNIGFEGFF